MGRTLKRVPLGFDWPLGQVWRGYLTPPEFKFPQCKECGGTGLTREANAVYESFYALGAPDVIRWCDKLSQIEVDNLWREGRLNSYEDGHWVRHNSPPSAADVNQRERSRSVHDAINHWILVKFRCKRLGIVPECDACNGHGDIATDEDRKRADVWEGIGPPAGDGYQLWETTTEGSPKSPVFESLEALAEWCAENATTFGSFKATAGEWRVMLDKDQVYYQEGPIVFI